MRYCKGREGIGSDARMGGRRGGAGGRGQEGDQMERINGGCRGGVKENAGGRVDRRRGDKGGLRVWRC